MSIMKMVYQAALNNGLSPNQARAFTAEVGRENDFNPNFIFGEHRDSNRDNVGIISWNQGRRRNLYSYLQKRGISTKNGIERSQRALDAQMGFAIHEIKTNPSYKATKKLFLNNPNVDYRTAEKVLGKNFIRWDYAGNSLGANVRKHHAKRDKYYNQLGGVSGSPQQPQFERPQRISIAELQAQEKQFSRPNRVPISELQAMEQPSAFERPERVPISQLQGAEQPLFERPERIPISQLQATEQAPSVFERPDRVPIAELQTQFARPERVPIEQLQGNIESNPMPELEPQQI